MATNYRDNEVSNNDYKSITRNIWFWIGLTSSSFIMLLFIGCTAIVIKVSRNINTNNTAQSATTATRDINKNTGDTINSSQTTSFTTNFTSFSKWCESAISDIRAEEKKNPIRASELRNLKLNQCRAFVNDKQVKWNFILTGIESNRTISLKSYHTVTEEFIDSRGNLSKDESAVVSVILKKNTRPYMGLDMQYNPAYQIDNIDVNKAKSLSIGDMVTIIGKIMTVDLPGGSHCFIIELQNPYIN